MRNSTQSFIDRPISTFIVITTPEILLTCLNINNNSWIKFDSHWYYKIEKKTIKFTFSKTDIHYKRNKKYFHDS